MSDTPAATGATSSTSGTAAADRVDIRGFSKDATELVREMEDFGWSFRRSNHGVVGRAPDGKTTTSVSRNLRKSNHSYQKAWAEFQRWVRKAHPDVIDIAQSFFTGRDEAETLATTDPVTAGIMHRRAAVRAVEQIDQVAGLDPEVITRLRKGAGLKPRSKHIPDTNTNPDTGDALPMSSSASSASTIITTRQHDSTVTLVNFHIWKPRGGRNDPTPRVVEQHWSDGSVDYACVSTGCSFHSPRPRPVAQHYGALHTRQLDPDERAVQNTAAGRSNGSTPALTIVTEEPPSTEPVDTEPMPTEPVEPPQEIEVTKQYVEAGPGMIIEAGVMTADPDAPLGDAVRILMDVQALVASPLLEQIKNLQDEVKHWVAEADRATTECAEVRADRDKLQQDMTALKSIIGSL